MKTFYPIIFTLFISWSAPVFFGSASAQLLTDGFSDGNFTSSPSWSGDTAAWRVDEHLRLNTKNGDVSQDVYLSIPAPNSKNAKWEFLLQMNFDPSAANRFKIYLFSDQPQLKGALQGYYLQVGERGAEDGFDLYRQDSLSVARIFSGPSIKQASEDTLVCRFSILRDSRGNWKVSADPRGGNDFSSYGTFFDSTYEPGGYFGLSVKYTPTRSGRFFFDDLTISDPGPNPVIPPVRAEWGTVLITEIFPDPSPAAGLLPEAEFFELHNTGDTVINLSGWIWQDQNTTSRFGNDNIAPGEYLIVCHERDSAAFSTFGRTACLAPFPSLNNAGDRLKLLTPLGRFIDTLSYSDQWYRDPAKADGGFSLERIAFSLPCFPEANWAASLAAAGGTPGASGSLGDSLPAGRFVLRELIIRDSLKLELNFNTFPETSSALTAGNYMLNNGAAIKSVQFSEGRTGVILLLKDALRRGSLYRLSMKNLRSCYGSRLENNEKEFLLPQLAKRRDVVINEILFNPHPGGADFVEIYNRSGKILDLQDLGLASHPGNDSLNQPLPLTDSTLLFHPGEYRLLSRYPDKVSAMYFTRAPATFLQMERFPAYDNKSGSCILLSRGVEIDRLDYTEDMHFQLIADPEGVSLEKTHFDLPVSRKGAFRSASATAGYATPGYRNSQFLHPDSLLLSVALADVLFTPDGDGWQDRLLLNYRFPDANRVANIRIFNADGYLVRQLAGNQLLGTEGTFIWDGRGDAGAALDSGPYLIMMEVFAVNGEVAQFKKFCVLARKK